MAAILIVAEKPSVARDIARVVGAHRSGQGCLEGNGYTVTWAIGHLVTLCQPHEINPQWKAWRREDLPLLPETWPLQVIDQTKSQFKIVKQLMKSCQSIICATDAGREGELIFRYIYEAAKCKKPVKRLWISSLTPDAIQEGMKTLQDGSQFNGLADAARARSCADWLIGMNLSRTYALTYGEKFFVGRVQTPTLAMIVKRDREIKDFKPEDYYEILAKFSLLSGKYSQDSVYDGYYLGEEAELAKPGRTQAKRLPPDKVAAQRIVERMKTGQARVKAVEPKTVSQPAPALYDLTELQRHCNRLYGFSASKTLETAQALYEKHKLISYPRTDSRYLSQSVANTLPKILAGIRRPYERDILESTGIKPLGSRFVNDGEVTDHHAIIPTGVFSERVQLSSDERKVYDLICRRLLSAYQEDYVTSVTTVWTQVVSMEADQKCSGIFRSQGVVVERLGWKKLEVLSHARGSEENRLPAGLKAALQVAVLGVKSELKKTKAPPSLTEAALLTAMETAGKTLDDRELAAVMKDSGLGTPATRAGMIETLLARGYLERKGKSLVSTALGARLIETVHPSVKSPELTARWEKELAQIESGKRTLKSFMMDLEAELKGRVKDVLSSSQSGPFPLQAGAVSSQVSPELLAKITPHILRIISQGPLAAGRLFEDVVKKVKRLERRDFEQVLRSLSIAGTIQVREEKFEKDGKAISYRKVSIPGGNASIPRSVEIHARN